MTGFVNCTPDFEKIRCGEWRLRPLRAGIRREREAHIHTPSFTLVILYGHARSAVGVASLPMGVPVEVEAIVEILA